MSDPEGKRWLWPVFVVLVASGVVTFLWRAESKRQTEAWRVLRARAAIMATELPRGTLPHAPLLGPTVPGEACEAYARAEELLAKARSASPALDDFLDLDSEPALPENATEMLPLLQPTLAALAAGAACATIDYGAIWSGLNNRAHSGLGALFGTVRLGAAVSLAMRTESAHGNHAAVVEATAHWLTQARDQWNFGVSVYDLFGTTTVGSICDFWNDSRLQTLPPESKRLLAEVLARFDAQCALLSKSPEGDFLWMLQIADDPTIPVRDRPTLEHLEIVLEEIDALQASRESGWTLREQALVKVQASRADMPRDHQLVVEQSRRHGLTNLRLLRLAVAHHLGEVLPTLRDPLGDGDLTVVEREDGIVLRSHGSIESTPVERFVPRR